MKYFAQVSVAGLLLGVVWIAAGQRAAAQHAAKTDNASSPTAQFQPEAPPPAQGFPRAGMQQPPGQFAGAATMQIDGKFLYIMRGPVLYKVDKNDLKVIKTEVLPVPGGGGGGRRGGFRPGDAGTPPPIPPQ